MENRKIKTKIILIALCVLLAAIAVYRIVFFTPTPSVPENGKLKMENTKTYRVRKLTAPLTVDADWNKPQWQNIPAAPLTLFMGEKPAHFPKVEFKVAYDPNNIYVIFRVEDQYVRAVQQGYQSAVCTDSCVEFFFTPSADIRQGYFNLETNCGGTILMHTQTARGVNWIELDSADLDKISIAHSLPTIVEPEIQTPTIWTVEYRLPFSILEKYAPVVKPAAGVTWKANFYKCADQTSHPHWLTWSRVDLPKPDFHRPEFFGTLIFE